MGSEMCIRDRQQANGSILYDNHNEVGKLTEIGNELRARTKIEKDEIVHALACTMRAIALLEKHCGSVKELWERQYRKALAYLTQYLDQKDINEFISKLQSNLGSLH